MPSSALARKPEESKSHTAAEPKEAGPALVPEASAGSPAGTPRFLRRAGAAPPAEAKVRALDGAPAEAAPKKEGPPGKEPGEKAAEEETGPREPARDGLQQASASPPEPPPLIEGAVRDVEILMPEPPAGLSGAETSRLERVERRSAKAAAVTTVLPAAEESTQAARDAVTEPKDETDGRAQSGLVTALGTRPAPSPEIEKLCDDIRAIIRSKRPPDEDSLVKSDPEAMAKAAGGQLNASIEGDAQRVDGTYDALDKPPAGTAQLKPKTLEAPPAFVPTPPLDAASATPDPVPAENVSLDADVEASQARMDEAGMSSEPAQLVQDGPIAAARAAQGELSETAQRDPAEVLAEQQAALGRASADMEALQQRALEALASSRVTTVQGTTGQQKGMVGSEEQQRTQISLRAKAIFTTAQTQVNNLLGPLPKTAMSRWDSGVAILSTQFKSRLSEVESWIEERHSGAVGAVVGLWDDVTGLPGWVTKAYDAAEKDFGDGVCELIRKISTEVNGVVAACEAIIADARTRIDKLYTTDLPDNLLKWAAEERAKMSGQLDGLQKKVTDTRANFDRDLVQRAASSVQEVREQIHALREKAKGLLGRIADAIGEFLDDPVKFIINGLLKLVGIAPSAFWALVNRIQSVISDIADDPLGFASNLLSALAEGFQGFFDRISQHLVQGLLDWLFSGLGAVGVTLPADLSLKSIITFFLQLMGITWPRIRQVLAKHIGEENVALIEKAYELIANLIELGPEGLFEMIKEQLNPQMLLDQVLEMARDYLVEALIKQVSVRIIALFNPVGAIVQAIEAIYRVLSWIFKNAARIFRLVETVVGGVADLIAGNISGMAKAVETALAGLISPVIDFLADYVGLGDLPETIADRIRGMQEWVMGIIDKVIGWIATKARGLMKALGIGGEKEEKEATKGDVKDRARIALTARVTGDMTVEEINLIIGQVFEELRPEGLKRLELAPPDAEGQYSILAEASPITTVMQLAPADAIVTLGVTLRVRAAVPPALPKPPLEGARYMTGFQPPTPEQAALIGSQRIGSLSPAQPPSGMSFRDYRATRGSGAYILEPPAGSNEIQIVSWNTGSRISGSNVSHAERQFRDWFVDQPWSLRERIEQIDLLLSHSPCGLCTPYLEDILREFAPNAKGSITYAQLHTGHEPTTHDDIKKLTGGTWVVSGPAPPGPPPAPAGPVGPRVIRRKKK